MNDIYYFHFDMTQPAYAGIIVGLTLKFAEILPNNVLSINENEAGTESLVKLVTEQGWIDTPESNFAKQLPSLIRIFTPEDHDEARVMVTDVEWTGVIE